MCGKCTQFKDKIKCTVGEQEKEEIISAFRNHLDVAKSKRQLYHDSIADSKAEFKAFVPPVDCSPPFPACSSELQRQHYTFDFAQPVCLPHFVVQPSQLYFKNLMKAQVYGICCDSAGVQYNYLFDEESTIGIDGTTCHGPDTVISLLHYHLSKYSLGEKGVVFHADNCYGQNKNKTVLHYMMWRIANGLNENITVNFMEPGHTKCRCDQLFGISKKLVKKSDVNNIYELGDIIQRSSKFNKTIQVRDSDGNQQVLWRNWSAMLSQHMRPLPGISKYYVFKMSADTPGKRSCSLCGPTVLYKDGRPWFVWRLMNFQKIKGIFRCLTTVTSSLYHCSCLILNIDRLY